MDLHLDSTSDDGWSGALLSRRQCRKRQHHVRWRGPYLHDGVHPDADGGDCVSGTPEITGVISAGAFGARTDFTPGTWLEVYGSNFSSITKEWAGPDFGGGVAPQVLDRVRVKVNGQDAYTRFVSAGQVNAQAPANSGTGPMNVTVTNCDKTSAPKSINQRGCCTWHAHRFSRNQADRVRPRRYHPRREAW